HHDREGGDVEELLGHVLDLQDRAPAERQRGRPRARPRRTLLGDQQLGEGVGADRGEFDALGGRRGAHAATSSFWSSAPDAGRGPGSWVSYQVRARKTSSRLGWPSEKLSTVMPAPASSLRARAACSAAVSSPAALLRRAVSATGSASACTRASKARRRRSAASGRWSGSRSRRCTEPAPTDAFSSPLVPSAITRPRSMTAIRDASWSASSRYCVVSRTVVPWATTARTMSHTWLRLRGSRPVV